MRYSMKGLACMAAAGFVLMAAMHRLYAQEPEATPAATQEAAANDIVETDATEPAVKEAAKKRAKRPYELPTSMFFSADELERIRRAIKAYERSKLEKTAKAESNANDFLNQLTQEKKEAAPVETTFVYPQFFLTSLVYHTPDDWMVMVNKQRFYSHMLDEPGRELRVIDVDDSKVTFEWKPARLDKVIESWAQGANPDVNFDRIGGSVTFTLRPNQTFSSYAMRVVEGKIVPVMVVLRQEPAASGSDKAEDGKEDKKIENITTDDIKNDVGMKALDKTYKRMGLEN